MFNKFINSDVLQSTLHVTFTEAFFEFVDNNSSILKNMYAVNDTNDILHINANKGLRLLVRLFPWPRPLTKLLTRERMRM